MRTKDMNVESIQDAEAKRLRVAKFLEELSWLLEGTKKRDLNLLEVSSFLQNYKLSQTSQLDKSNADQYVSPNPNIHYLIGVLPRLFQDRKLFKTNDEIAEFANDVLNIEITRVEKRSKHELIGIIVCETNELNDQKLRQLVESLQAITASDEKLGLIAKEKESKEFSWNMAIRKLSR